jgi:hypothetical protein
MRKEFSIRLRIPEYQGREIHQMALRENRSQSSAISILVSEALNARRSASASAQRLVSMIRGEASDFPAAQ